jgi:hypothetical protein
MTGFNKPLVVQNAEREAKRAEDAALAKREAREEETLSIARKALANSRLANKIAITAAILAAVATIMATVISVMYAPHP